RSGGSLGSGGECARRRFPRARVEGLKTKNQACLGEAAQLMTIDRAPAIAVTLGSRSPRVFLGKILPGVGQDRSSIGSSPWPSRLRTHTSKSGIVNPRDWSAC